MRLRRTTATPCRIGYDTTAPFSSIASPASPQPPSSSSPTPHLKPSPQGEPTSPNINRKLPMGAWWSMLMATCPPSWSSPQHLRNLYKRKKEMKRIAFCEEKKWIFGRLRGGEMRPVGDGKVGVGKRENARILWWIICFWCIHKLSHLDL